jgi:hypothetical protein
MATLLPYTNCGLASRIDGTDCIGDSRYTINRNFSALEVAVCNLSALNIRTTNVGPQSTLGTLVSSLSVFNTTGTYMGYIPLYR